MSYTLYTSNGRKMSFFVEAVAEAYRKLYGGTLVRTN